MPSTAFICDLYCVGAHNIVMDLLLLYRVGAHNAFLSEFFVGGVMDLVYGSSFLPLHGLSCVFQ